MIGLFLVFCALFLLLALLSFDAADPSVNYIRTGIANARNKAGLFGAYAAGLFNDFFGIAALVFPCVFACLGIAHLSAAITLHWWRWAGFFLLTICLLLSASALDWAIGDLSGGGVVGQTLLHVSTRYLSSFGAFLIWAFLFLTGVQLVANFSWLGLAQHCRNDFRQWRAGGQAASTSRFGKLLGKAASFRSAGRHLWQTMLKRAQQQAARANKANQGGRPISDRQGNSDFASANTGSGQNAGSSPVSQLAALPDDDDPFAPSQELKPSLGQPQASQFAFDLPAPANATSPECGKTICEESSPAQEETLPVPETMPAQEPLPAPPTMSGPKKGPSFPDPFETRQPEAPDLFGAEEQPTPAAPLPAPAAIRLFTESPKEIVFPSPELLNPSKPMPVATPEDLEAKGQALMSCFNDFDIQGELARITPGPVVTMFEVRPAPGIRVSKIANLSDDLSLALKAVAVRIQAPIPGTDTVGIEIPNDLRETVNFRELVEAPEFERGSGPLTMILGKTIAGAPFMADLTKMPHMLVAGATGAGKSVCLNSILVSLLYRVAPKDMRLLLVDPKRIELAVYADLPHLVHPVVTEMEDAKQALEWAVDDMKKRYKTFEKLGVRNIVAYHQKLESFGGERPAEFQDLRHMPYMVIVIDELADLMMTAAREVETSIVRLAQLARAAGIHMILATQRPSVDVVTGLIKANFPCRISFQVTSKHDSRTILDQVGAEHLLGRGDMLFKPSGGRLLRLHGPFLTDEEVQAVANHWKAQLSVDYQVDFAKWSAENAAASPAVGGDATTDALYGAARDFVLEQGRASISLLQRHLKIGFNRAARLMEQFERDGLIGPADGSKPRNVLR